MSDLLTSHSHCIGATQEKPVHTLAWFDSCIPLSTPAATDSGLLVCEAF